MSDVSVSDTPAILGGTPAMPSPAPPWPQFGDAERAALTRVLESGVWGGYHEDVRRLEREFAALHDSAFGIATANGTVSLEIALAALGIQRGDEVIVPPISFVASATAIARVGAVPVFADVARETINLDVRRAEAAITSRTRAIVLVHFAGWPADLDSFVVLCRNHGLALIEDCAHAPGAEWRGRKVGSFGAFGSFSFQASKNLTAGEGGMLVTGDADLAERAWSIGNQGRRTGGAWYEHVNLGTNARLTGFQASLLLAQLERLPAQVKRRAAAAARLRAALATIDGLEVTPAALDGRITAAAHHLFSIWIEERAFGAPREAVLRALAAEGLPVSAGYPHPLYRNALFQSNPHVVHACPVAEEYCRRAIWLPHQALLASDDWLDAAALAFRKVRAHAAALPAS